MLLQGHLIQRTLGDTVTLSLGGGQGNGTTDPSADSDLKGHEVGTRSAESPATSSLPLSGQARNPKTEPGPSELFQRLNGLLNFQDWRTNVCVGSRLSMRTR